jgi:nucleoside 2-deoxyribosyltransferase
MKIYLAGPINACTDDECHGWREQAKQLLGAAIETLDPMRRDYRGKESESVTEIVRGDLQDIESCDALLVNVSRPSWGTAMEVAIASRGGKPVFAFGSAPPVSPWLMYHCKTIHADLASACAAVLEHEGLVS